MISFPDKFISLTNQVYSESNYSIVPIRYEDRYDIMKWRNQQIYHLRQNYELTVEAQDDYFKEVVSKIFNQHQPQQLLFSYLHDNVCFGYGGLVHINWVDKNAEISFVMNTEEEEANFEFHWVKFLGFIEKVAFDDLKFSKIFTYSYNIRPRLYTALEIAGFKLEARLPEHSIVKNQYHDVLIHSKRNSNLTSLVAATPKDIFTLYEWANDPIVRDNAINKAKIELKQHFYWFINRLSSKNSEIYIYQVNGIQVGQVRIDLHEDSEEWYIDYSIAAEHRGKKYGKSIIECLINLFPQRCFIAQVKNTNLASIRVFEENGFKEIRSHKIQGIIIKEFRYKPS